MIPPPVPEVRLHRSHKSGPSQEVNVWVLPAALYAPQLTACLPWDAQDPLHQLVLFKRQDKPQRGCRSEGPTSTPGHYSKKAASPGRLCSNKAAVNETIYCAPINVQPQDPCMASPIVLSVLIKAGSSRHLRPLQLG